MGANKSALFKSLNGFVFVFFLFYDLVTTQPFRLLTTAISFISQLLMSPASWRKSSITKLNICKWARSWIERKEKFHKVIFHHFFGCFFSATYLSSFVPLNFLIITWKYLTMCAEYHWVRFLQCSYSKTRFKLKTDARIVDFRFFLHSILALIIYYQSFIIV